MEDAHYCPVYYLALPVGRDEQVKVTKYIYTILKYFMLLYTSTPAAFTGYFSHSDFYIIKYHKLTKYSSVKN